LNSFFESQNLSLFLAYRFFFIWRCSTDRTRLKGCAIQCTTFLLSKGDENMAVEWNHDIDTALSKAKAENRAVLMDFSSAPA
jgi:hypothetical protein